MSKFKVGDKVRVVADEGGEDNGKIGVVARVDPDSWYTYRVEGNDFYGGWNPFNDRELEAVSETPKEPPKFYVIEAGYLTSYDTLEKAEAWARECAADHEGTPYVVLKDFRAFEAITETRETAYA